MKTKIGRPTLPKNEAKAIQIGVRFNPKDGQQIQKSASVSGQTSADFVRNAAIAEMRQQPIFFKSEWKSEELEGKLVEFRLTAPDHWVEGVGKFRTLENNRGEICIDIIVQTRLTPYNGRETRYFLYQKVAEKIEIHPNSKKADFRLLS